MLKQELNIELKENIENMYLNKKMTIKEIGIELNKSTSWVAWKIKNLEIPLRTIGETKMKSIAKDGKKTCSVCLIEKDINQFNKGRNKLDGLECWCKECRSKNHIKYLPLYAKRRKEIKKKMVMYKGNICARCNIKNLSICCFSFHHTNPEEKLFEIGDGNILKDWDRLKKELDKCIMVCFNCHQIIHFGEDKLIEENTLFK